MIFCGEAQGGELGEPPSSSAFSKLVQKLIAPMVYGGTDVDLITGDKTFPNITQSETFTTANPDNPDQIVVGYTDTRGATATPPNGTGASVSTDGGNTFTRLTPAVAQSRSSNPVDGTDNLYFRPSAACVTVSSNENVPTLCVYKHATMENPES